jgi:hypothetical protein
MLSLDLRKIVGDRTCKKGASPFQQPNAMLLNCVDYLEKVEKESAVNA